MVPHNREAPASLVFDHHQEKLKSLSMEFKQKMKIKDQGMGEYSFEPMCLSKLPTSPKSHRQPSASTHQATQLITKFDGKFIQLGTIANESKEKDILSWLYKDEEEVGAATLEVAIPTEHYGKGF